jgi:hypothetical protein
MTTPLREPLSDDGPKPKRAKVGAIAIGDHLICDEPAGVFRPCIQCGSKMFRAALGKGPHVAQLICMTCDRRGRWLGIKHLKREKR